MLEVEDALSLQGDIVLLVGTERGFQSCRRVDGDGEVHGKVVGGESHLRQSGGVGIETGERDHIVELVAGCCK